MLLTFEISIWRRLAIFKKKKKTKDASDGNVDANAKGVAEEKETGTQDSDKEGATKIDLKNTMILVVIGIIALGSAFVFVTKFHSSKDVYDITTSADAAQPETSLEDSEEDQVDDNRPGIEKERKEDKKKSKSKDKDKKNGNDETGQINNMLDKILVPLDSIVVNLGKVDSKRYLRVIISLEVKSVEIEETIKANKVVFRDKLVSFLSSKSLSEISTQTSHIGMREEIKDILNSEVLGSDDAISQVYFSDFIIQ
ncbi:flagellar basal body-associated FliL family protein [Candidatus Scalindua japonica]|uniref:flagellar basal body-associated FliL family protein n=1 Tax=Candidatus Scalindua japonica TaxID=1284222 RepID=UPI0010568593|nr:flagellar basal body-associated FliL family protein [Candidatus Scalindua japonica]